MPESIPGPGRQIRLPKAAELVAADLRAQIVGRVLAVGEQLPAEAVLMARFGVSRPTMREAFRVLESEGLLSVRRGARGGAIVQVPTVDAVAPRLADVLRYHGVNQWDIAEARLTVRDAMEGSATLGHLWRLLTNALDEYPANTGQISPATPGGDGA